MVAILSMPADTAQTFLKELLWIPQYATREITALTAEEIDATHSRIKSMRSLNLARFTQLQVLALSRHVLIPRNSDYGTIKSRE